MGPCPCLAGGRVSGPLLGTVAEELSWRANLHLDLADFERRARRDPALAPVVRRWRGMRPMHLGSLYEYLVIAIVLQNATVRRSVQMLQALFERFGTRGQFDGCDLYGFWGPAELAGAAEDELRALKVGYRARSLLRVSEAVARGDVDEAALRHATSDEQRAALLSLYGIGPASVGYILVDVFHAFDELGTSRRGNSGSTRACSPAAPPRDLCRSACSWSEPLRGRLGEPLPSTTYGKTCSGGTRQRALNGSHRSSAYSTPVTSVLLALVTGLDAAGSVVISSPS